MLVRNRAVLHKAMKKHAASRKPLREWIAVAEMATWRDITEVRRIYPHADFITGRGLTCFNVGGNNFRLMAVISYHLQTVSIHEFLTHDEYDKKYVRRK